MAKKLSVLLVLLALGFILIRLFYPQKNSNTLPAPKISDYDNMQLPKRDSLLVVADYLTGFDRSYQMFNQAKSAANQKLTQYVSDIDVVLADMKKDHVTNPTLEGFKAEGQAEIDDLKNIKFPSDIKIIKSTRLMYILVGDWRFAIRDQLTAEAGDSLDKKLGELGVSFPR